MEAVKGSKVQRKRFEDITLLGSGSYGEVFSAFDVQNKKRVAIKRFRNMNSHDSGISAYALRELSILRCVSDCKFICTLIDIIDSQSWSATEILLVMEQEDSDLDKWMNSHSPAPHEINYIIYQLLKGCEYLHQNCLMHRDIKPDNILINEANLSIKIADFGQARAFSLVSERYTLCVQAMFYRAPELLLGCNSYNELIDVWSIGCVYAELLGGGEPLFGTADATAIAQLHRIFQVLGTPSDQNWSGATKMPYYRDNFPKWSPMKLQSVIKSSPGIGPDEEQLLSRLLRLEPAERIGCTAALSRLRR